MQKPWLFVGYKLVRGAHIPAVQVVLGQAVVLGQVAVLAVAVAVVWAWVPGAAFDVGYQLLYSSLDVAVEVLEVPESYLRNKLLVISQQ